MLLAFLKKKLGVLLEDKSYTIINVGGLAIGIASCVLLAAYVQDELSYDSHWSESEKIYRLNTEVTIPGSSPIRGQLSPVSALSALESYFPNKIAQGTRTWLLDLGMIVHNVPVNEKILWVDNTFPDMFELVTVAGSLNETFLSPNNIALSEAVSIKLFGNTNSIEEIITIPALGAMAFTLPE